MFYTKIMTQKDELGMCSSLSCEKKTLQNQLFSSKFKHSYSILQHNKTFKLIYTLAKNAKQKGKLAENHL